MSFVVVFFVVAYVFGGALAYTLDVLHQIRRGGESRARENAGGSLLVGLIWPIFLFIVAVAGLGLGIEKAVRSAPFGRYRKFLLGAYERREAQKAMERVQWTEGKDDVG